MPRAVKSSGKARHDPLHIQLKEDEVHEKYGNVSRPGKRRKSNKSEGDDENKEVILDPKTSQRIFELAKAQQEELESPDEDNDAEEESRKQKVFHQTRSTSETDDEDDLGGRSGDELLEEEEYPELQIDAGDLETLDALLPHNTNERRTLADMIFAKLDESAEDDTNSVQKITKVRIQDPDRAPDPAEGLNPKVVEVYTKVGQLLQRGKYKSGPLPKAFKIIPSLPAWARILALTRPENWSPQATRAATRIFISNMKPPQARVFLQGVVLDAVRSDIQENGKLSPHYYEALKRSLYKPGAFFKGIIFPLLESGATLKESAIIASVLAKVKVPLVHSAAALIRLANMDYSGPNSLFIRVLVDKKYALPYKVVDALVFHFIRLSNTYKAKRGESEKLPVLWHQSLLVFTQRYSSDLTPDQKDALLDVVKVNPHPQISSEIRRELVSSTVRGEPRPDADGDISMI
ncbi:cell adhesion byn-1 [Pyrrhoderma noxium]|uniref:Cell adhesion byn-1 n=1 Tax=Pyrrhoderma noxium TaxID=2282107 RepID=A0A286UNT8_9AGAM|nr:cell adhesion byn-1 [Pyrrhoderma noxium]